MRLHVARIGIALLAAGAVAFVLGSVDADSGRASARAVSATGAAAVTNSFSGDAVVRAADMAPGERVSGTVTVGNVGDATGAFSVVQSDVLDTPGEGGGRLSTKLRLDVEDAGSGRRIYRGRLGAMSEYPLGYVRAGEEQTYRFTVTFPRGPTNDSYAGSRVETTFDWSAVTREPPADPDAPRVVAQLLPGPRPAVALTCDEPCSVVGRPAPTRWLAPGKPALVMIEPSGGPITVADRAGNRTRVSVPLRVAR